MLGRKTTIYFKMLEIICNWLPTHPYKCMKTIIVHFKAHTINKWKKTYEYKASLSMYCLNLPNFNGKFQQVAKDIEWFCFLPFIFGM